MEKQTKSIGQCWNSSFKGRSIKRMIFLFYYADRKDFSFLTITYKNNGRSGLHTSWYAKI